MGRFKKLNDDVRKLGEMILQDQDLCKLIYYPDDNPLEQPNINGRRTILGDRLLLFTPKLPLAKEEGTYVSIRPSRFKPTKGGYFIVSLLCFYIYCQKDIRPIMYKDKEGNIKTGDRVILIMDRIEEIMNNVNFSVGKDNLYDITEIANNNATFSGYVMGYEDVDFRNLSR